MSDEEPKKISQFIKTLKEIDEPDHKFNKCAKKLRVHGGLQVNHFCVNDKLMPSSTTTGICHGGAYPSASGWNNNKSILYWVNNYHGSYPQYQPFFRWITNTKDSPWRWCLHKSQIILDDKGDISCIMHKADVNAYLMINMGIGARLVTEHGAYPQWFKLVNQGINPALAYIFAYYFQSNGTLYGRSGHTCFHQHNDISIKNFLLGTPEFDKSTSGSYQEGKGNSRGNKIWNHAKDGNAKGRAEVQAFWTKVGLQTVQKLNSYGSPYNTLELIKNDKNEVDWNLIQDNIYKELELEPYDPQSASYITGQ